MTTMKSVLTTRHSANSDETARRSALINWNISNERSTALTIQTSTLAKISLDVPASPRPGYRLEHDVDVDPLVQVCPVDLEGPCAHLKIFCSGAAAELIIFSYTELHNIRRLCGISATLASFTNVITFILVG